MRRFVLQSALILAAAAGTTAACGILDTDPRAELRDARGRWAAQEITSYEYTFRQSACECLPEWTRPHVVRVEDGAVVEVRDEETGDTSSRDFVRKTIPDLFDMVSDALEASVYRLEVRYHPTLGFPTRIEIDHTREMVDGGDYVIDATDFRTLG
jgi:hypothetical protein